MTTDLAIVIVSHNAREDLERCLQSLLDHPPATPHDILVVDNASSDGSVESVRRRWPEVRVVEAGANLGFGGGNNLGIRQSQGELVLLLNSDTIVPAGAIDRMVDELVRHREAAILGPRLVDRQGKAELSFGRMIGPFAELIQKTLVWLHERRFPPAERYVDRRTRSARTVDWVSGACLLVRRADAVKAGLLDERYFLYCEDVDFCAAVRRLGRSVRFAPVAEIVHLRGRSRAAAPDWATAAYRRSQLAFYAKHHPRWVPLLRLYLAVQGKLPKATHERF